MSVQSGSDSPPDNNGVRVVAMFNFEAKEAEPFPPDPHGAESSYDRLPQHAHTSPHARKPLAETTHNSAQRKRALRASA